jgi:hypothetical protein
MLAGLIVLLACPKPPSINPAWLQITGGVQCPSSFYVLEPCYSRFSCSVVDCNWTPREPAMPMHFGWWDARRHGGAGVTIWVTTFAGNVGLSQRCSWSHNLLRPRCERQRLLGRALFNRCDLCRCDLCRLTLVRRQDAAEGHANYKHHGKHHSNYTIISWRTKPSHLLVQKFLVASVHFYVPNFCRCKRNETAAVPLTVGKQLVSSLISGRKINTISTGLRRPSAC